MKKKDKKTIRIDKKKMVGYLFPSIIVIFIICLIGCLLDYYFDITGFLFGTDDARSIVTDFFLVEVQVTFIVVSLSTALSTQSKRVYWVDSFQYRLIRPKYTNFTALSSYILATLIVGIFWEILDRCIPMYGGLMGVFLSFILSLVFMIILSMRMIGANFGEEAIKAELEAELLKYKERQKVLEHIGYDAGLRIPMIRELVQVTFQEAKENQLDLVCENLDLLFRMGFRHELKRCYGYVKKTLHSQEIMEEIDFTLMRNAVLRNEDSFFYMDCPLSFNSVLTWWEEMIDERFDEAIVLWTEGKKDKAKQIRKDLYAIFSKSMFYRVNRADYDALPEMQTYEIISLMGRFVERRKDLMGSFDSYGEPINLGKDWTMSEYDLLDDEELKEDIKRLVTFATKMIDRWLAGDISENIREIFDIDVFTVCDAKEF